MPRSLGEILERKRMEEQQSQQGLLEGVTRGQLQGQNTANTMVAAEREKESKEFNPLNAIASGVTGFVTSGGNPVAAGLAALSSSRGNKFKPLESVGGGLSSGISVNNLGAGTDTLATLSAMTKSDNIAKTIPILTQAGAPKEVISALETYSKAEALKAEKEKERTSALEKVKAENEYKAGKNTATDTTKKELAEMNIAGRKAVAETNVAGRKAVAEINVEGRKAVANTKAQAKWTKQKPQPKSKTSDINQKASEQVESYLGQLDAIKADAGKLKDVDIGWTGLIPGEQKSQKTNRENKEKRMALKKDIGKRVEDARIKINGNLKLSRDARKTLTDRLDQWYGDFKL